MSVTSTVIQTPSTTWFPSLKFRNPISVCTNFGRNVVAFAKSDTIKSIANSILGKAVIFLGVEIVGAYIGGLVGENIGGDVTSRVARLAGCILISTSASISAIVIFKENRERSKPTQYVVNAVAVTIILYSGRQLLEPTLFFSEKVGLLLGKKIWGIAGAILGGYSGLKCAGSPIVLYGDKENFHACYLVGMLRYAFVGEIFHMIAMVSKPLAQTSAYNSHIVLPLAHRLLKKKEFSYVAVAPLIEKLIAENCSNHSILMARDVSKSLISSDMFPAIIDKFRLCLTLGTIRGIDKLLNQTNLFTTIILRSFYKYVEFIKSSESIHFAYESYTKHFFDFVELNQEMPEILRLMESEKVALNLALRKQIVSRSDDPKEVDIMKMVEDAIPQPSKILEETLLKSLPTSTKQIDELVEELLKKIPELEIGLIGVTKINPYQQLFLQEVLKIFLFNFLLFAIHGYLKNKSHFERSIDSNEEVQIVLDLNKILSKFYLEAVLPRFLTTKILKATNFVLKGIYSVFVHSEQESIIRTTSSMEGVIKDNYYTKATTPRDEFVRIGDTKED